jgi:RNA polymerase sigma factor (sigma-70 family)
MPRTDENYLWAQVCNGDKQSLELLYNTYAKSLYQYGLKFTPKIELIEDVIQDLFVRIFNSGDGFVKDMNVKSYLIKSFRNNLFRMLEKEKRYFYHETDKHCFDVTFSIEHRIMANEEDLLRKKKLMDGIGRLTSKQKEIIYLRYTRGLDYDEISDILNMEIESCRNVNYHAIKALRNEFKSTAMEQSNYFRKKS